MKLMQQCWRKNVVAHMVTSESVYYHIHPRPSVTCGTLGRGTSHLDAAGAAMLKEKCGGLYGNIWVSKLPHDQKALHQHIIRANYQVNISKVADVHRPRVPQVTDGCTWTTSDDKLRHMWFQGPLISANLAVEDDRLPSDEDITSSVIETDYTIVSVRMIKHVLLVVSYDWKWYFKQ